MKILVPLRMYLSPRSSALVATAPASEPALGSVRPKAPMCSPLDSGVRYCSFCSSVPNSMMGYWPRTWAPKTEPVVWQ